MKTPRPFQCRPTARLRPGIAWFAAAAMLLPGNSLRGNPPDSPSPTPDAGPKPKPTPAVVRHIAPAGVLYLTEDVVVPIKGGLNGVAAGTEVKLVKEDGDTVQVSDGGQPFSLKKRQVTDDQDVAAAIRKRAAAVEAANEISRQQQEALFVRQQREQIEFLRSHPLATPTPTPTVRK